MRFGLVPAIKHRKHMRGKEAISFSPLAISRRFLTFIKLVEEKYFYNFSLNTYKKNLEKK